MLESCYCGKDRPQLRLQHPYQAPGFRPCPGYNPRQRSRAGNARRSFMIVSTTTAIDGQPVFEYVGVVTG